MSDNTTPDFAAEEARLGQQAVRLTKITRDLNAARERGADLADTAIVTAIASVVLAVEVSTLVQRRQLAVLERIEERLTRGTTARMATAADWAEINSSPDLAPAPVPGTTQGVSHG